MTSYIRAANPIWYMVDLTGEPLNDEYYAFFLENTFPYLPAAVYRDPNGDTVWTGGIVQFQPSGTLPNNLYFADDQVYRIEIRRGNSQTDPLIWEINDFDPGAGGVSPASNVSLNTDNQVSNPQFSFISFASPFSITASGTYRVAPGWDLVLTGSGTATVSQITSLKGSDSIITNPAYSLRLQLSGWTEAKLRQRFAENGSIWASTTLQPNSSVTLSAIAISNDGVARDITIGYQPSNALIPTTVASGTLSTTQYTTIAGAVELPTSTNSTSNPDAYVDLVIILPNTGDVSISSVQAMGENTDEPITIPYEQISVERQLDHLFHYYAESLIRQPKNTLLAGWDFGLNPWQFYSVTHGNVATNQYTADQTILIQQNYVATGVGNNVAVTRASFTENQGFKVTAVTAANQFGILQYIDGATMIPNWNATLSSMVKALINTAHSSVVKFKVRLIYRDTTPGTTAQNYPVLTWAAGVLNGAGTDPVFHSDFNVIIPRNDPVYTLTSTPDSFPFEGMVLPVSPNNTSTVGLFVYLYTPMSNTAAADSVVFNDVSLVKNDFAMASNSKTYDQVLKDCQYYYCKTFKRGDVPAQNIGNFTGALSFRVIENSGLNVNGSAMWFFPNVMRAIPTITGYNPIRPNANWENQTATIVSGPVVPGDVSEQNATITDGPQNPADAVGELIAVHLTADARLGI